MILTIHNIEHINSKLGTKQIQNAKLPKHYCTVDFHESEFRMEKKNIG